MKIEPVHIAMSFRCLAAEPISPAEPKSLTWFKRYELSNRGTINVEEQRRVKLAVRTARDAKEGRIIINHISVALIIPFKFGRKLPIESVSFPSVAGSQKAISTRSTKFTCHVPKRMIRKPSAESVGHQLCACLFDCDLVMNAFHSEGVTVFSLEMNSGIGNGNRPMKLQPSFFACGELYARTKTHAAY